jgi:hypothetical protein
MQYDRRDEVGADKHRHQDQDHRRPENGADAGERGRVRLGCPFARWLSQADNQHQAEHGAERAE